MLEQSLKHTYISDSGDFLGMTLQILVDPYTAPNRHKNCPAVKVYAPANPDAPINAWETHNTHTADEIDGLIEAWKTAKTWLLTPREEWSIRANRENIIILDPEYFYS